MKVVHYTQNYYVSEISPHLKSQVSRQTQSADRCCPMIENIPFCWTHVNKCLSSLSLK